MDLKFYVGNGMIFYCLSCSRWSWCKLLYIQLVYLVVLNQGVGPNFWAFLGFYVQKKYWRVLGPKQL